MDYLGLIVIGPIGTLAGWGIYSIYVWLKRLQVPELWWKRFWVISAIGLALGIWWAFFFKYQISNARLEGFPIPIGVTTREKPGAEWMTAHLPALIRLAGVITDILSGVALCLVPVAIAAFLRENRMEHSSNQPPV